LDEDKAISLLPSLKKDNRGRLKNAVKSVDILTKGDADFNEQTDAFVNTSGLREKFAALTPYINFLGRVNNTKNFKLGIDTVVAFREKLAQYGVGPRINAMLAGLAKKKEEAKVKGGKTADLDEQIAYIKEKTKE